MKDYIIREIYNTSHKNQNSKKKKKRDFVIVLVYVTMKLAYKIDE